MKKVKNSVAAVLYIVFVFLLIPLIYPSSLNPDRGIFESVSYRLLANDKLYVDVWDNKEPLFYYINAITLRISPVADLILETLFLFLSSLFIYQINKGVLFSKWTNYLVSFFVTPLIIIQINYFPGYTHLPGEILTLGILLSIIKEKYEIIGILLGLLLFTKITFFPIVIAVIIYLRIINYIQVKKIFQSFIISFSLVILILIYRGEFWPFIQSLNLNYIYAINTPNRVNTFITFFIGKIGAYILIVVAMLLYLNLTNIKMVEKKNLNLLNSMLVCTIIVAFLTSKNYHHLQILTPIILLTTVFFMQSIQIYSSTLKATLISILTFLFISSHIFNLKENIENLQYFYKNDFDKSSGQLYLADFEKEGTYARLGQNDDNAHAKGLQNWVLVCPRFHQYPFDNPTTFAQTANCIENAGYLIISPTFKEYANSYDWNQFVKLANIRIEKDFNCKSYLDISVCKNTYLGGK